MDVEVFIPCFIDQLYPKTAVNTLKILRKAGCNVHYNPSQTCCGQPAFNSGYWKESKTLAQKFLGDFGGNSVIVSPSASCTSFIRNYYKLLFEGEQDKIIEIERLSERLFELTDFLVNQIKYTDFGADFPHRVTFHDSCAGLREYGIKIEPRILLKNVNKIEFIEMENTETCCGFGGTFSAKFHHISTAMTHQKVENALKSNADYIISTEASCLMNMESYIKKQKLPIKTLHIADILANFLD